MPLEGAGATFTIVTIPVGGVGMEGELAIPPDAHGIVLFAHGSGSSRRSPRNQFVASELRARGLATLLFDLLTPDEEMQDELDASLRFDIDLLAQRLVGATDWVQEATVTRELATGYFGASTGAAAALIAAAARPETVAAVVSRGGRPDLAASHLGRVRAPTLLIVGEADSEVLALNRAAFERLECPKELAMVPGATHLFEEPGALEDVASLAATWFAQHLLVGRAHPEVGAWP
jgi:putative phosphoribosyl transferase